MKTTLIVAVAENGVIGRGNQIPWHLPDDLKRFKALTMGHHVLLGRKTFEGIGRPLAGRTLLVVTRNAALAVPPGGEVVAVPSIEEGRRRALDAGERELFVAGGAEVYGQTVRQADLVHLTRVLAAFDGDALFPPLPPTAWRLVAAEHHDADAHHAVPFRFEVWERWPG